MTKEDKKLRMVKEGEGGGAPTPVSKLDVEELTSLSMGKYKVFTNGAEEKDLKGKYLAVDTEHIESDFLIEVKTCISYTSPSPRDATLSRIQSSALKKKI